MADDFPGSKVQDPNLLVRYRGEKPDAPDWFNAAIGSAYEAHFVTVEGAKIRYQSWGNPDHPGVLLSHGNGAHAHWYDFIAPALAETHHVVAMSFSGMGDSDWRDTYSFPIFSAEQMAVCEAAGLLKDGRKPVIVAHSFGGFITLNTAQRHSDQLHGVIIVDSGLRPPEDEWEGPPIRSTRNRVYASLEDALGRFRLAPPQPCENHYIVDYIARHSLKQVTNEAGQTGWTWKFDPKIFTKFLFDKVSTNTLSDISCRVAMTRGRDSELVTDRIWDYMRSLREDMDMVSIENAQHHVLLDQPLAFIEAIQTQLNDWKY